MKITFIAVYFNGTAIMFFSEFTLLRLYKRMSKIEWLKFFVDVIARGGVIYV